MMNGLHNTSRQFHNLEQKVSNLTNLFQGNRVWQFEKTVMQEQTMHLILETIANITALIQDSKQGTPGNTTYLTEEDTLTSHNTDYQREIPQLIATEPPREVTAEHYDPLSNQKMAAHLMEPRFKESTFSIGKRLPNYLASTQIVTQVPNMFSSMAERARSLPRGTNLSLHELLRSTETPTKF